MDAQASTGLVSLPCSCGYDDQTGHGTDHDGIDEWTKHGYHSLPDAVLGLCRGLCHGRASKTCFIGKDASCDSKPHGMSNSSPCKSADCGVT